MANANGQTILEFTARMGRAGTWHADIVTESEVALAGAVTAEVDGVTFVGTVVPGRSGVQAGRCTAKVVGGAGGLSGTLEARNYANGPTMRTVIDDILRDAGETLSPDSEASVMAAFVARWERLKGPASRALQAAVDELGLVWRVLGDGTVWVGAEAYPEADIGEYVLIDEDWTTGCIELAPESPDLVPAVTLLGQPISYVVHRLTASGLRTYAYLNQPGAVLERFLKGISQAIDYSRMYPARVVSQAGDKTLQVVPDDPRIKGAGLGKVKIRHGLPGFEVNVLSGARVMVGFDEGNPAKPFAALWDAGGSISNVEFVESGLSSPSARVGDTVILNFPYVPLPTPGPPVPFPVTGVIQSGNPKLLE